MNVDIPLGLWLVALAATALVTAVTCIGVLATHERAAARRVTAFLLAWLAADVGLGLGGVFAATPSTDVPLIAAGIAVPAVAGCVLLTRRGTLRRLVDSMTLRRLVGLQAYRTAGIIFLVAWAAGRMPGIFALPAGIGDIAVGLAAPFVASRMDAGFDARLGAEPSPSPHGRAQARDDGRARRLAIVWNVMGIADLVVAVTLGFLSSPSVFQQLAFDDPNTLVSRMPFVLIPTFAVPLSIVLHVAALLRLRASGPARESAAPSGAVTASRWAIRSPGESR
ncbi:MAG TPA: hypothetical protein VFO60_01725 [Candidatus Dormibacteraeota bacterium]|nr:hypothetical protein [Candidatus Dormibacteraeota bacterium]